MICKANKKY